MLESCTRYRGGRARTGIVESGRGARSERDVVAGTRGSLPAGGGGTEQTRTLREGLKLLG